MEKRWYTKSLDEIKAGLETDFEQGLTQDEAVRRREQYGYNDLPRGKKLAWWRLFFRQLKNPLVFILLIAALLTFWIREFIDMTVILLAVLVNVGIGFSQEYRSNKIFEKLQAVVRIRARIKRGGKIIEADSQDIVPGDVVLIKAGMKIPADGRLISARGLEINEALLTGESSPVRKEAKNLSGEIALADRKNMVYTGTVAEQGEGEFVITATGAATEVGQIARLTAGVTEEKTPLEERLARLGRIIALAVLASAVLIFAVGVLEARKIVDMFTVAVAVAVAAIPEGLPAALSVVLAIAAQKIFRKNGLIKHLVGAETLGSTTVICTDKTGTLTEGKMKVEKIIGTNDRFGAGMILALANEAIVTEGNGGEKEVRGEGTDRAKMEFFIEEGGDIERLLRDLPRKAALPFDQEEKYMASFHALRDGSVKIFVNGAPEELLRRADLPNERRETILHEIEDNAAKGFRMIGMAERVIKDGQGLNYENPALLKSLINGLNFFGLAVLRDPIRDDVKESVSEAGQAGVRVIMVTGDHRLTAEAVGKELGFPTASPAVIEGKDLDEISDEELGARIDRLKIFARSTPKHKMRIISALKKKGAVVAMTGDGVNDAPALKAADIGISLGSGTDVTKEAADLVLLNDSFSIITSAIRQGRIAFDNIRKVTVFLLANSFTELILVMASLVLRIPLPITAVQILWANLVEDGLPNFALAFEPGEKDVMRRKPLKRQEPILDRQSMFLVFIVGIITDFFLLAVFLAFYFMSALPLDHVRTIIFAALATDSLFYVFSIKSLHESILKTSIFNNWYLIFAVLAGFAIMIASIYAPVLNRLLETVPLSGMEVGLVLGLGAVKIVLIELTKWWFRKKELFAPLEV